MKKKFLIGGVLLSAAAFTGVASATSAWEAAQTTNSQDMAQAANLTISVSALTPKADTLPDTDGTAAHMHKDAKGSLSFSVQNTGDFPLKVQSLSFDPGAVLSDKSYHDEGLDADVPCAARLYLNPSIDTSSWPTLEPGAVLYVDTTNAASHSDGSWVSGSHLVGLDFDTPVACMGATFSIPLQVHASDAS